MKLDGAKVTRDQLRGHVLDTRTRRVTHKYEHSSTEPTKTGSPADQLLSHCL